MIKRFLIIASLSVLGARCYADTPGTQPIGPFGGLNTNISKEAIDATQSPDLLNVDISVGGKSVKKRQGFGLDVSLAISTSAVHNLYKFFDASGNEVRLAFNDNKVSSSINGATWTTVITTGTVGATWDCTDYLGYAYCVSSAFDNPIKTNGTTAGTTGLGGTNAVPAGSLVSTTGDRLLVGATSANPSRIYYSASTVFTDFSLGTQSSSSSFEDILAPGSKLTHLAYHYGRWLWWKDQSFGFIMGTGQFDLNIVILSNTIGTLDNTDIYDNGITYFRGTDGQIYTYNGSTLSRSISTDIAPTLRTANRRKANSWQQTSSTDWVSGRFSPSVNFSTSSSPGDLSLSTWTVTEASSGVWTSGSSSNMTVNPSSFSLTVNNNGTVNDPGFDSAVFGTNYVATGNAGYVSTYAGASCTISPQAGSTFLLVGPSTFIGANQCNKALTIKVLDAASGAVLASQNESAANSCAWTSDSVSSLADKGKRVKFKFNFSHDDCAGNTTVDSATTINSYVFGGRLSFYTLCSSNQGSPQQIACFFDTVSEGSSTVASGSLTSQTFDTGLASSTIQGIASWTVNTSTPYFAVDTSVDNTVYTRILTSSGTNATAQRYVRYVTTINVTSADNALTSVTSASLIAVSTGGVYYTAVNNAANLSSWNSFISGARTDGGTIAYYTRASTTIFSIASTTPTWVAQPNNATVTASTGTYFQARADFASTSSTAPFYISDVTFNWFEGSAADKMYGTYFSNGIWFSLSLGTATTNNRIFRYDLLSNLWTLYDIPANGFLTYNNNLYFAGPSTGCVFQFGNGVYSDNGAAINAYWKSKPFFGDSPFSDDDLRSDAWYIASDSGTTLNITYTLNESTSVTRSLSLYDSRRNIIQNNWNFPGGSIGTNFAVQVGDNSTSPPWEVFGGMVAFISRPWKVYP